MVAACDGGDGPLFDDGGGGGNGDGGAEPTAGDGGASGSGSGEGAVAGSSSGGAAGASGCPRACGPTFEQFFDNMKLATLRITIDAANLPGFSEATWLDALWEQWKHCAPFNWTNSTVQYESPDGLGDITLSNVGMRLRGSMKRGTNQIQGFKLDFQVLDTPGAEGKRRFADLNRVNVLSVESDPSHMIQCLAYEMLRDAGIPAPRCNHLKIYVNGEYYGLMQNVEQVNKGYLRRHFGTSASSLYAGSPSMGDCPSPNTFKDSQAVLAYSGDSFASYASQYQLTHGSAAEAETNLIPMLKCGDPAATPDDTDFKACIAGWLDVPEWLREIAAESIMPSFEAMVGYYRNYYLYFAPDDAAANGGRFQVWSWDLDTSFQRQRCNTSSCDILTGVANSYGVKPRAKLIQRLTSQFRPEYCAALNHFLEVFTTSAVDQMAAVVAPGFVDEPSVSAAAWQTAVSAIKTHITARSAAVKTQIAAACE
jgi:hypothetical protein